MAGQETVNEQTKELEAFVDFMERRAVRRLRVGDIEIELAASQKAPAEETSNEETVSALKAPAANLCRCGHDLDTEHNSLGCLYGCSEVLCRSTDGEERTG